MNFCCSGLQKCASTGRDRGAGGVNIVHQNNSLPVIRFDRSVSYLKGALYIAVSLPPVQPTLAFRRPVTDQMVRIQWQTRKAGKALANQRRLGETALEQPPTVQWDGNDTVCPLQNIRSGAVKKLTKSTRAIGFIPVFEAQNKVFGAYVLLEMDR